MTRVVLDANVLVSGFAGYQHPENTMSQLLLRWQAGTFGLVVSDHIRAEFIRTLGKPYYSTRITPKQLQEAEDLLDVEAESILVTVHVAGVATHPEDDLVLATAVSAAADYLVTGDRQLQQLNSYQGVQIVSPRDFLTLLDRLGQDDEIAP
jgi:putative PIN family toxin of toxin-antitoxin system